MDFEKIQKFNNLILSNESIYILILVILNIINICVFYKNKNLLLLNGLVLLFLYFLISQRQDKKF